MNTPFRVLADARAPMTHCIVPDRVPAATAGGDTRRNRRWSYGFVVTLLVPALVFAATVGPSSSTPPETLAVFVQVPLLVVGGFGGVLVER